MNFDLAIRQSGFQVVEISSGDSGSPNGQFNFQGLQGWNLTVLNPCVNPMKIFFGDNISLPLLPLQTYRIPFNGISFVMQTISTTTITHRFIVHSTPNIIIPELKLENIPTLHYGGLTAGTEYDAVFGVKRVYVESFGNVQLKDFDGTNTLLSNVPAGTILDIICNGINDTGTTSDLGLELFDLNTSIGVLR